MKPQVNQNLEEGGPNYNADQEQELTEGFGARNMNDPEGSMNY